MRARLDADANAGVAPSDDDFIDTTEGGFWFDMTQAPALEVDRLWDFLGTEVPTAMYPSYAFGEYLDEWGVTLNVPRKASVQATGVVTFTGEPGTPIATHVEVSAPQTDPDADPVGFETTASGVIPAGGTLDLPIQALAAGAGGNQPAGAVSVLESPVDGVASVANALATSGGADVESDDLYRERILLEFSAAGGAGTVADYQRWALSFSPVGHATVEALWAGNGSVRVIVTDQDNNPVSPTVVDGLQALLDPIPGQGAGLAPIGAIVTVATPTTVPITVAGTVSLLSGYSLDGTAGSVGVRQPLIDAITEYINSLEPGEDVVLEHVKSRFFTVEGVYDVSGVTLNGAASNVAIASLEVAVTQAVNLS